MALALLNAGLLGSNAGLAAAQDDEVIVDPELESSSASSGASDSGDQVISDPELEGGASDNGWGAAGQLGKVEDTPSSSESEFDPQANTGIARLELDGRFAGDLHQEGDLEDVYENRFRFDTSVEFRRSRRLRMSVGIRTDLLWALPGRNDPALDYEYEDYSNGASDPTLKVRHYTALEQDRYELDIIPTSAYLDATLGDGFHLRFGSQQVSMARSDFFSPSDILAAYDLRGQPTLEPGTPKLAQPAVRIDWDLSSWATLQAVYVPWFMPHLSRPSRDGYVAKGLGLETGNIQPGLDRVIDPSYQTKLGESGARFVGPVPDFSTPQAQLRLNMRGSSYEFGVTGGTALEKMPMVYVTPALEQAIRGNDAKDFNPLLDVINSFADRPQDLQLFDIEYNRFYQVGIDGSIDIAPVNVAFELTYSPSRQFYAATLDGSRLPMPNVTAPGIIDPRIDEDGRVVSNVGDRSIRKGVPVIQGVLHVDWLQDETFAFAAEAFWVNTLRLPYDKTRDWVGFRPGTGAFLAGVIGATYRLNDGQWSFETSLIAMVGPSMISVSQIELRVREGFYLNIGLFVYEGTKPKPAAQALSVGGLLSGFDQAFIGFRYLP